jgi:serine/threonine protein kinase
MLYQICQAAYSCHELHTIHRDLKPENVLLTRDRTVKLCDFGVARQLDENSAAASFCGKDKNSILVYLPVCIN